MASHPTWLQIFWPKRSQIIHNTTKTGSFSESHQNVVNISAIFVNQNLHNNENLYESMIIYIF